MFKKLFLVSVTCLSFSGCATFGPGCYYRVENTKNKLWTEIYYRNSESSQSCFKNAVYQSKVWPKNSNKVTVTFIEK